jgi:hypothetical protein
MKAARQASSTKTIDVALGCSSIVIRKVSNPSGDALQLNPKHSFAPLHNENEEENHKNDDANEFILTVPGQAILGPRGTLKPRRSSEPVSCVDMSFCSVGLFDSPSSSNETLR